MHRFPIRASLCGFFALALAACGRSATVTPAPQPAPAPRVTYASGSDVIAAMRQRYDGKWYSTITFKQATSRLGRDGKWTVQTWYEAGHFPGRLRIDFDPVSAGNGVLYARDSVYSFRGGRALPAAAGINDLLLLGFDVYFNAPARTEALLRKQGFNVDRFHMDSLDGRPMLVVGAAAGDRRSKQFWIDAEHLYFVRSLERAQDTTKMQDVRFVNYRREGSAWVSPRVEIHTGTELTFHEDYSEIRTNVALDEGLFSAATWKSARHWLVP